MSLQTSGRALERISSVIGVPASLALVGWFGKSGLRVYVPTAPETGHVIERVIGPEAFEQLVKAFGGQYINVPDVDFSVFQRAAMIHRLAGRGLSTTAIGEVTGISRQAVGQIKNALRLEGYPDLAGTLPE